MFQDFKELLSEFNAHQVRYLVVGGYAVSFHAQPRATKDLDILVSADADNSKAVYAALAKFGAPVEGLTASDFSEPGELISREDLLAAKIAAGRPQDLADVAALRGLQHEAIVKEERSTSVDSFAGKDIDEIQRQGRERWLKQRRQRIESGAPTLEEMQAKAREEWLKMLGTRPEKPTASADDTIHDDRALDSGQDGGGTSKDSGSGADDDLEV